VEAGYNGTVSSKTWKRVWEDEQRLHKDLFYTMIVSVHPTRNDALEAEFAAQKQFDAVNSDLFINKGYAHKKFWGENFKPGHRHTEETKAKMRNRVVTEETRRRMSEAGKLKAPMSEETRAKMLARDPATRLHSTETKAKISRSNRKPKTAEAVKNSVAARLAVMTPEFREKLAANRGKHWYNNGTKSFLMLDTEADGLQRGRL
jgi:hypothetical protein